MAERWSSRLGFILANVGAAVGLGSIWKFPYEVGANGGGAFVFFYLFGLALIVTPLMFAEFAIGRRGQADAAGSMAAVARANEASPGWALVGTAGVLAAFLILSFYSVIGGWTLAYALQTIAYGLPDAEPDAVQARFDALLGNPLKMSVYHALFMATTVGIVARGIAQGIEAACKVLMPILVVLIVLLAIYGVATGGLAETLRFMFVLDIAHFSARAALEAIGLGFFSIGVGLGLMITYAAYAGARMNLREVVGFTIVADTAISFLAGFAIFPIVFANALDPSSGPGLLFVTLPIGFARMPIGSVAAVSFFALLFVAALASAISMLELSVTTLTRAYGWRRPRAAVATGALCWVVGLASVLSFNAWADWYPLPFLPGQQNATWFDLIDHLTSNLMLPVGGLLIAVFAGWYASERLLAEEIGLGPRAARVLRAMLRYVVPAGVAIATLAPLIT
jgi:NSS family neurotransmitter:Na+ symporter